MNYYYLLQFKADVKKLQKKNHYKQIIKDILQFLTNKPKQQLIQQSILIKENDGIELYKCRIANSLSNKGKRGGYRFYIAFDALDSEKLIMCLIYPKDGPKAQTNLTDSGAEQLLKAIDTTTVKLDSLDSLNSR